MNANPFLGVIFHWLGGLASGSFYVPYRGVKKWSWETYWLAGGFFSWIIAPWILASINTQDILAVLQQATSTDPYVMKNGATVIPWTSMKWAYFWGMMWGLGGLTFGLTMRYLGMSLGMGVALGYCAAFGTLMPPIFSGEFVPKVLHTTSGQVILVGVAICLAGIAVAGMAGMTKEKEMSDEEKRKTIKEFNFMKGILVATFSGIMSASFAYGLTAAEPIAEMSAKHGTTALWTGLPKLIVVLLGGFTTNFIWCALLNYKNRTGYQYFTSVMRNHAPAREEETIIETAIDAPSEEVTEHAPRNAAVAMAQRAAKETQVERAPMLANYLFCALAGTTWYFQFFFYTMGETQMGNYKFSSWTLHMASIIIFSSLWGIFLHEWKGSSGRAKRLLGFGLAMLVFSTMVVGYGNYLGAKNTPKPAVESVQKG